MLTLMNDVKAALIVFPNVEMLVDDCTRATVAIDDQRYSLTCDDFDEDEDDPIDEEVWDDFPMPSKIRDHCSILDVVKHVLASKDYDGSVTGLTSDGDNDDCEAIFKLDGDPTIFKIRPTY